MVSVTPISSPPPSERPAQPRVLDSRDRLNQLAHALANARDPQLLHQYLQLRSVLR